MYPTKYCHFERSEKSLRYHLPGTFFFRTRHRQNCDIMCSGRYHAVTQLKSPVSPRKRPGFPRHARPLNGGALSNSTGSPIFARSTTSRPGSAGEKQRGSRMAAVRTPTCRSRGFRHDTGPVAGFFWFHAVAFPSDPWLRAVTARVKT